LSPAVSRIQSSVPTRTSGRYEALPPWLLSMIVHMLAVIGLGLAHISTTPGNNLQLLFLPTQNVAADDIDATDLADINVDLEAEPMPANIVADSEVPLSSEDMLTSLDADWSEFTASESGAVSLVSGIGDGTLSQHAGGKGYASLFGLSGEGGRFVYVFDRSGSMNSMFTLYSEGSIVGTITPLLCAKQELIRSLEALSSSSEFQIVFYNHSPSIFGESHYSDQLYAATPEYKEHAKQFVEQMGAHGFTNHFAALEAAFTLNPDVIFLLTDGEAKDDLHPSVVRRMFKYCQRRNIVINVVHFSNVPRPECTLIPLAEKTGGEHLFLSLEALAESMVDQAAF
jgi:hypothetical protein